MNFLKQIEKAKEQIILGEVESALESLLDLNAAHKFDTENAIAHASSKWYRNENDMAKNLITREAYALERDRITNGLFKFLDRIIAGKDAGILEAPLVFLMYDLEDEEECTKLKRHLTLFHRRKEIRLFDMHDNEEVGEKDKIWGNKLAEADIVLCLITFNFLFTTHEWAEKAHQLNKTIIPVLINVVNLDDSFLKKLRALPSNGKFVAEWPNADAAYADIVTNLRKYVLSLRTQ